VVFVHGILSDGERCWKNENGTYWPELLASSDKRGILSIFVYTYESDIFSADYNLDDVVDDLRQRLRNAAENFPRIVFVCHSMGGIVARRYLVRRQLDVGTAERRTIFGLLLVASPSLGSDWGNWLLAITTFFQHSQADALRFSKNNHWLDTLDRDFRDLKESGKLELYGRELIEDKFIVLHKSFFAPKVVEPISGARYFGEALKIAGSAPIIFRLPNQ
jgi:pimeloyl-ACP methyl ester carboxylesterase